MDSLLPVAQYFIANVGSAFAGILYWMTLENFQNPPREPRKLQNVSIAVILTILFTPFVALLVVTVYKYKKTVPAAKGPEA